MSRPYHERTSEGFALSADPADAMRLGLLRATVLPIALVLMGGIVGLLLAEDVPSAPLYATLAMVPLGGLAVLWGLFGMVRARANAEASRVVWNGDALRFADGRTIARSAIARVVADQPNKVMQWRAVRVEGPDKARTAVLGGLPPNRGPDIAAAAEALAAEIGVPVEADEVRKASVSGMDSPSFAALCYLPFQGICVVASVLALSFARDPLVRFSAKQSLLWFAVSTAAILGMLLLMVVPLAVLPEEAAVVVGILTLLLLVPLGLVRIGVFLYAAWKAWYGVPWLIPGLSAVSRRWLPEAAPVAEAPVDAGVWSPPAGG